MKRLLLSSLLMILLAGCSDDNAIPPPNQNMEGDQVTREAVSTPQSNAVTSIASQSAPESKSADASPLDSKRENPDSTGTVGQIKQKTRKISSSLANSTKDWRKKWSDMNKDRVQTNADEDDSTADQKADMDSLKQQYGKVKKAVVNTSKAAIDKVNDMTQ